MFCNGKCVIDLELIWAHINMSQFYGWPVSPQIKHIEYLTLMPMKPHRKIWVNIARETIKNPIKTLTMEQHVHICVDILHLICYNCS